MGFSATSSFQAGNTAGLVDRIRQAAGRTVDRVSRQVLQQAQVIVPIDTGELYNSGNATMEEASEAVTGYVNFDSDHAVYPEFGTRFMAAQPYLRPSLDAAKGLLLDTAKEEVSSVLE